MDSTITNDEFEGLVPHCAEAPGPRRWGHLQPLEKVGQGRFGEVYRAWDTQLEREVALKLWRTDGSAEKWSRLGLLEARLLARIRHPNVVRVYGVDYHEGRLGVWMEYIRGRDLEVVLEEQGPLAAREAALIGVDVCSAVAAAHASGLLHRDIKTRNVMREEGGRIVLMDFGLGQDLNDASWAPEICGTPHYMAPELLRREKASVQSDIYGIGILLYHLVTECFPVDGGSMGELRRAYERGEITLLRDRRADLPELFLRAIERALSPEPAGRYITVGEMAQALTESLVCADFTLPPVSYRQSATR